MKYMYHCTSRASQNGDSPEDGKIWEIWFFTVKKLINWRKKPKIAGYLCQGLIWSFQSSNLCTIEVARTTFPRVIAQKWERSWSSLIFLVSALSYFSTTASGTLSIAGLEIVDSLFGSLFDSLFKRLTVYIDDLSIDDWSSILESSILSVSTIYIDDPI